MKNILFSGLMIGALVALIGAVGLLNTPSANAEPNCDKARFDINKGGKLSGNWHCQTEWDEPIPECNAAESNPQDDSRCQSRGEPGIN